MKNNDIQPGVYYTVEGFSEPKAIFVKGKSQRAPECYCYNELNNGIIGLVEPENIKELKTASDFLDFEKAWYNWKIENFDKEKEWFKKLLVELK